MFIAEHGHDAAAVGCRGEELPLLDAAVDDLDVAVGRWPAGELELAVVLVRPEPRHRGERLAGAAGEVGEQRAAGVRALLDGVVPVLDPDRGRSVGWSQRATSPAATTPGAAAQVASHTTPSSRARPLPSSQPVTGDTPMPTTTTSASIDEPSARRTPLDPVAAVDAVDAGAEPEVDAVVAVQVGDERRPSPRRAPRMHGAGSGSTTVTSSAEPAGRGRHLAADEPGADDDDPARAPAVEVGPQGEAVVERAQDVDAAERRASPGCAGARRRWRARGRRTAATSPSSSVTRPAGDVERRWPGRRGPLGVEVGVDVEGGVVGRLRVPARTCFDSGGRS